MVFVHAGGNDLLALFRERHLFQPGQSIRLKPRKDAAHIFDTATGKRI
jgi:multiple sugar transport system ATP-binding protein